MGALSVSARMGVVPIDFRREGDELITTMKITTKVCLMWDEDKQRYIADPSTWEGYEYDGPIEHCGGGPSQEQKDAASANARLSDKLGAAADRAQAFKEAQQAKVDPFYTNLMKYGPDYTNAALDSSGGINARAYAPARAALIRRLGSYTGLPSGYRDQALTDFDENQAANYDSTLMSILADQQASKERGAAGIMGTAMESNPLGYYSGALQGNSSVMNANLRKPGLAGTIGGLAGGALATFA